MKKLDIVIVTFNRLDKLKHALQCFEKQTVAFRNLIVVNNCSSDGTKEYLDDWAKTSHGNFESVIIHSDENLGGSGGFYLGQKKSMELGADWVYVADDDAYAAPDMLEKFYEFEKTVDTDNVSAICGSVHNMDGSICLYHRDRYHIENNKLFKRENSKPEDYNKSSFDIDILSYVGSFLNGKALKKVGLVNPDYFIYFDDTEHSIRLKKYGRIVCVPSIVITHEGGAEAVQQNNEVLVSWRDFYLMRNEFNTYWKHFKILALHTLWWWIQYKMFHSTDGNPKEELLHCAFYDAMFNRLGKHSKYRPGWQIIK